MLFREHRNHVRSNLVCSVAIRRNSIRADYDRIVAAARAQLDEAAFDVAWAAGRALTLDEAIAEALREA